MTLRAVWLGAILFWLCVGVALSAPNQAQMCKVQAVNNACPEGSERFVVPVLTSRVRTESGAWMMWPEVRENTRVFVCPRDAVNGALRCPVSLVAVRKCEVAGQTCEPAVPVPPGTVRLRWTIPTLNTDGSALTNYAGIKIYSGAQGTALGLLRTVTDPRATTIDLPGFAPGAYQFQVTAFTTTGQESARSNVLPWIEPEVAKVPEAPGAPSVEFIPAATTSATHSIWYRGAGQEISWPSSFSYWTGVDYNPPYWP